MKTTARSTSRWWLAALVAPYLFVAVGLMIAMSSERSSDDWLAGWLFRPLAIGLFLGSLLSFVAATVSGIRGEEGFAYSFAGALPSAILIGVIACFAIEEFASREHSQFERNREDVWVEKLRVNPQIGIEEKWYESKDDRCVIFRNSFSDPQIHYSKDMIEKIYVIAPGMRDYLFLSPACSTEFLEAHYQEAFDRCDKISYVMLASIVSNSNTPIDLVEKVAQDKTLPFGAVEPAKIALKKRKQLGYMPSLDNSSK